jgi:trans-L-3-hydroxyproline dehydratase
VTDPVIVESIDAHAAGEPLRIVTSGVPALAGDTILAKRADMRTRFDHLRRAIMLEPRGHADMYGAIVTDPVTDDGDVGVLFVHNEGYSTMCGHGIIALTTVALERGLFTPRSRDVVRYDTPAGRVTAKAERSGDRVTYVEFENVPSFVRSQGSVIVELDGATTVDYTLAYGGAFYAYVDAGPTGLRLDASDHGRLVDWGRRIKHAVAEQATVDHPDGASDLDFLYGTIFVGSPNDGEHHSRNVCVFADGEVDRSPTGTGVSGRAAIEHHLGRLEPGRWITIESVLGTTFDVRVARRTRVGDGSHAAIVPEVRGSAWITGEHKFVIDPGDPLRLGFMLR